MGEDAAPTLPFASASDASLFDPELDLAGGSWDRADDPTLLSGPSAITSLGARAKAVAYTRPLHDLDANKTRWGGEDWGRLNLIELGFHAIDVVALRMDFDSGARHDDVIAALGALARHQAPDLDEPWRVGERVLEGLITGRGHGDAEAHQAAYGSWGPDGYVAKRFDYALLTEHVDEDGEFYLRATDPAISVLMGALDVDVESAQIASELRLNELIKRGLLAAAITEAQRAKYRSIQYMSQLQRQLSHAQLHTTDAGALGAVDRLVEHALEHVVDRYQAERAIIANVAAARDQAVEAIARRRANQLIAELEDCGIRHQQLQKRLIRARREFRTARAEQLAAGPTPPSRVDLERQLLRPALRSPLASADRLASLAFRLSAAPQAPALADLDQLIGSMCALPSAADDLGDPVDSDDLVETEDRRRFDDETWDLVDEHLDGIEAPTQLSDLLAGIAAADRERGPAAAHLLTLRALHELDPALAELIRQVDAEAGTDVPLRWWRRTGTTFETPTLKGDDLAVFPAWATPDPDELPPDPFMEEPEP